MTVYEGVMRQGSHVVNMNSQNLETGLYYYRTTFEGREKVMKMLVVK
jgi:hypothetical protein